MKVTDDQRYALYKDLITVLEGTGVEINEYLEEKVGELVEAVVEALDSALED